MLKKPPATGTRKVPVLRTDEEAEAFLMQDLSDLDFSQFKPMHFEFEKKEAQVNMRVPQPLLDAVKDRAKARGIPYTRYIRMLMERDVSAK
jgi:predicted DNA binding CopG/RHH family protein